MKPKWLIEDFDERNSYTALAAEVIRQGMECEVVTYTPFQSGSYNKFANDDCVVVQASLQLARQLVQQKPWIPNAWLTLSNYECSTYYAHLGKYLFNDFYAMMPVSEVKRNFGRILQQFGKYESVFVRPSSGFKTFTGQLFSLANFEKDWSWVEEFSEPHNLAVVTTPKDILAEWRFVVTANDVITGCQYRKDSKHDCQTGYPDEAFELAKLVAATWQPDRVFVVDICQGTDKQFYLLEIGSFSCAGLYACDMTKIVEAVSQIATEEYLDAREPT